MPRRDERVWALARFLAEREDAASLFDRPIAATTHAADRAEFDRFMSDADRAIDRLDDLVTGSVEYTARTLLDRAVARADDATLTGPHIWAQLAAVAVDVDAAEHAARFRLVVDEQVAAAVAPARLAAPVVGNCRACRHPDAEHYSVDSDNGRGCSVVGVDANLCGCQLDAEYCTDVAEPTVVRYGRADEQTPAYVFDLLECIATGSPLDFHGHPVPVDVQRSLEDTFRVAAENAARNDPAPADVEQAVREDLRGRDGKCRCDWINGIRTLVPGNCPIHGQEHHRTVAAGAATFAGPWDTLPVLSVELEWEPDYGFTARNTTDVTSLAAALEATRRRICAYGPTATRCDCKYGAGVHLNLGHVNPDGTVKAGDEQSGCPEISEVIHRLLHRPGSLA
jgi:hypothetical protein